MGVSQFRILKMLKINACIFTYHLNAFAITRVSNFRSLISQIVSYLHFQLKWSDCLIPNSPLARTRQPFQGGFQPRQDHNCKRSLCRRQSCPIDLVDTYAWLVGRLLIVKDGQKSKSRYWQNPAGRFTKIS